MKLRRGKEFSKDLVLATVLTGLREPLKSQVQFRMSPGTTYTELREWILQYEALNTPWGTAAGLPQKPQGGSKYDDGGQQPMDVDRIWAGKGGKSKDGKGKGKDSKGKNGKDGKNKGKDGKGKTKDGKGKGSKSKDGKGYNLWNQWGPSAWSDPEACRICGKRGHWKWECPQAAGKGKGGWKGPKGKVNQVEQQAVPSSASSAAPSSVSTTLPPSASVYRGNASVNVVTAHVTTPPGCRVTEGLRYHPA